MKFLAAVAFVTTCLIVALPVPAQWVIGQPSVKVISTEEGCVLLLPGQFDMSQCTQKPALGDGMQRWTCNLDADLVCQGSQFRLITKER